MLSARAFGIHRKAVEDFPERFEVLTRTFKQAFDDPRLLEAYVKSKGRPEYLKLCRRSRNAKSSNPRC